MKTILTVDEINRLEGYDYTETDKHIKLLTKRIIRRFSNFRGKLLNCKDNFEVLTIVDELYSQLRYDMSHEYLEIIKFYNGGKSKRGDFLTHILNNFNPVTLTVFVNEVDRKRAVFFERLVSSKLDMHEVDKAMVAWSRFVNQGAIDVTDAVISDNYKRNHVKYAVWVTSKDERVCDECYERDGIVYELENFPDKPHPNCRCRKLAYNTE